ncbi:MAG: bacterial Ig-like domain-containing protein [Eubacteriales bacterium]|nr:bacterial Ig-like domain-containing protein [Eubacteriales bacterium]
MSNMSKKVTSMLLVIVMVICSMATTFADTTTNNSRQLVVSGNQLVYADDPTTSVRLTGVNIAGGEWTGTPAVERMERSTIVAINNWNCNLLRIPVSRAGWFGDYDYVTDGGTNYREYIDGLIDIASQAGIYVVLDFHHYKAFNNDQFITFWQQAATRYANNPTVLFGILNEPHSVGWQVWRNGSVTTNEDGTTTTIYGHQYVVEMIRDLGAKNIIVAGGLDWGYSLTGITNGYALVDQGTNNNATKAGHGIMYDTHIYPWKGRTSSWNNSSGAVRMIAPVLVGECGWDAATNSSVGGKTYQPGDVMYHDKWVPELLNWMDDEATYGAPAHYTAYCLHPSSAPRLIGDKANWKNDSTYSYPPTDFWGKYVKAHLAQCATERKVGYATVTSISVNSPITDYFVGNQLDLSEGSIFANYSDGSTIELPFTADGITFSTFDSSTIGPKTVTVSYMGSTASYTATVRGFTQWAARATFDAGSYIEFASNAFDIKWNGATSADTMKKVAATGLGIDGTNGLGFDYARSGGWGGVQTATLPSTWNWSKTKYISFSAKIIPTGTNTSNGFAMTVAGPGAKCNFTATTDWQYYSFDLSDKDLSLATQLQWTVNNAGTGKLVIDDLTISNYAIAAGEAPVADPVSVEPTALAVGGAKTSYIVGEEFEAPIVTATFSDGTTSDVAASFSGYDMSAAGTYTVNVLYQDIKTTYSITVESSVYAKMATFDAGSDIVFASNAFDVRWTGQTSADIMRKTTATGEGIEGTNGLGFTYARTGGWGGVQTASVPNTWNWSRLKYISFYAKIAPTSANTTCDFSMTIAGPNKKCNFTASTDWEFFSFNLSDTDLSTATKLQWTVGSLGEGKLIVDNLAISNYELDEGETPDPDPDPDATVTSIAVSGQKTSYVVGDAFVAPTVTATYSDGSTQTVAATFTGYDMSTTGTQTVTATFEGITATYQITVSALTLSSIAVSGAVTQYTQGDAFIAPTVIATYSNGSTANVEATFTGYDMNVLGTQTVTVTFEDKTTTYVITVNAPAVTLESIAVSGAVTEYTQGDTFIAPTVVATYSDGSTANVAATFTGYDMDVVGSQTVTATYEGETATYTIYVEEADVIDPEEPVVNAVTYLDLDFEDAAYQVVNGVENKNVITTTNNATEEAFNVNLYPSSSTNVYNIYSDSTNYIAPNGRKQNCAYDMSFAAPNDNGPLYVDMRIKRVSYNLDDPVSVAFTDNAGNIIFYINYTQSTVPSLVADQTYSTDVTYPLAGGWRCVRAIIDFETSTFKLYQGEDFENMTGFINGVETFPFRTSATNLARITNYGIASRKGSIGFDDIKVYNLVEETETFYVQQNFDDATLDVADYITDASTGAYLIPKNTHVKVDATNLVTGANLPWFTYNIATNASSSGYFYAPYSIGTNEDGSTNYALMPNARKRQATAYMTIDEYDTNGDAIPAPIYEEGKKTVVTMRIRRYQADLDDPVTLSLRDINGNKIFSIVYQQNLYPQLVADATYGGESNTVSSVANYPFNSNWMYLKAEIDFDTKTFALYVGETLDAMNPYITNTTDFGFNNLNAQNLYKFMMDYKGSLGIDDLTISTR